MAELGSIYEEDRSSGPRGRDLRIKIRVPTDAVGDDEGAWIEVPERVELDGEEVARTVSPHDRPGAILLRLPEGFRDGACLRLRGQGETPEGGRPGDLFLEITLDAEAPRLPPPIAPPASSVRPASSNTSTLLLALAAGGAMFYFLFGGN